MNIRNKIIKLIVGSIAFSLFIIGTFTIDVFADKFVLNTSNKNLFDETNTFEYIGYDDREYEKREKKNELRFDLSKKIENEVDDGAPLLTVLTHGLGGSAADWSNDNDNFTFGYSPKSLISKLAKKEECNIYLLSFQNNPNDFLLINITAEIYLGIEGVKRPFNSDNIEHITDISKHSIIVFDAYYTVSCGCNDDVYTEFNYAISRIVYDIKKLNNNKLPKINLIGHSRGGITNMQYALDHPDLVASIYSLGTPYLGTTSGAVGYAFKPSLLCSNQAANDILNPSVYESYMKRWNEGYDEYYKNIKVNAFAGYSTGDQIISLLATDALWEEFIDGYSTWNEFAKSSFKAGAVSIAEAGYVLMMKSLFTGGVMTKIAVEKLLTGILNEIIKSIPIDSSKIPVFDFVQILTNEINFDYHFPFISWYNDGCVDLGSALGYVGLFPLDGQGYKGFNRTTKAFGAFNCDMNALSRDMPPVVHNLEARDKELNNYILADINLGSSTNDYLVRNVYDANGNETNEVYIDQFLAECDGNTLTIPSSIYGKTVVGISDYAFANNCYGKSGITTINIPDSVRYIGKNAFYNSDSIATINIGEDSELSEIRDYAFSNIPNLLTFTIPSSLKQIGDCAFLYSGIEIFTCENNRYDWIDNVLVDKNSYLNGTSENNYDAIYVNSKIENLRMPDFVKSIDNYVFKGNRTIKTIDLNNVEYIGLDAFSFSTLENIINYNQVKIVENGAFDATPWKNNQNSDCIKLGDTLIECNLNEDYVVIDDDVRRISSNSFHSTAKGIIIGKNVESIGENAFSDCPNLKWVLFTSIKKSFLDGKIAKDDVDVYVPSNRLNDYKNYESFKYLYGDNIKVKDIKVTFSNDNTEKYYSYGSTFVEEAEEQVGKDFLGWIVNGNESNILKSYSIFEYYLDDILLTPKYEPSKYTIALTDFSGDLQTIIIEYGSSIDASDREGYEFVGWYNNKGIQVADANGVVDYSVIEKNDTLQAKYELIVYSVEYDLTGGVISEDNLINSFTVEHQLNVTDIGEPTKFGYVFDYWEYDSKIFNNTQNEYNDINLKAVWKGTTSIVDTQYFTIKDEYSVIDMKNMVNRDYVITVSNNVQTVAFLGYGKIFSSIRIIIQNRDKALILGLSNITLEAPNVGTGAGYNTIESNGKGIIYLNIDGIVNIYGGTGASGTSYYNDLGAASNNEAGQNGAKGGTGCKGGAGIKAYSLIVDTYQETASLNVYGGSGGYGGKGQNGQRGSTGVNSPSGWFWGPVKGDNGANGGNGGNGGRGGDGGYAIEVSGTSDLKVSERLNYYFKGGNGGNAGSGGKGGMGGFGADDVSSDIWHGVGDPGDGGNGGNGGDGGRGGNGSIATNAENIYGQGGTCGYGGQGGLGGEAGIGGKPGEYGDSGTNGKTGEQGEKGKTGTNGSTGYNLEEKPDGISNSGYMFNKKFIARVLL